MKLYEYCKFDGLGLAELVRTNEVTAKKLRECALQAIEIVNPELNSVMDLIPEDLTKGDGNSSLFAGVS